ncbi:MAG TPA: hypothetical protein VJA21_04545 [Verrucomicrobiae bacterium]
MNDVAGIASEMPPWFPKLITGPPIFGKRKDRLVLEILDLGGMELLETECGLPLRNQMELPKNRIAIKVLARIKKRLVREKRRCLSRLSDIGHTKLALVEHKKLKPGVHSFKFGAPQKKASQSS